MAKRYDMEYGVNKFHSKEPQVVPVQSTQGAWVSFEDYAELQEEVEALKYWRKLALQFDGHRMNAMSMLKMVATGNFDMEEVRKFIAAAPVSGDKHLTEIRAQAGRAGYIKGANEWCEFPYENSPYVFNAADQYANRVREVKND